MTKKTMFDHRFRRTKTSPCHWSWSTKERSTCRVSLSKSQRKAYLSKAQATSTLARRSNQCISKIRQSKLQCTFKHLLTQLWIKRKCSSRQTLTQLREAVLRSKELSGTILKRTCCTRWVTRVMIIPSSTTHHPPRIPYSAIRLTSIQTSKMSMILSRVLEAHLTRRL